MLLYQNIVMIEAGLENDALQHLQDFDRQILDRLAVDETKGKFQIGQKVLPLNFDGVA
jgi:N-alpha-acetyltransferase 15/16, NatA auxiliary subunit